MEDAVTKATGQPGPAGHIDLAALLASSPLHQWLGIELVRGGGGEVELRLPYRAEFQGDAAGTNVHGGIIGTLADIAGCFALISATDRDVPTIDIRIDYVRMARPGEALVAVARTVKAGRTVGLADVEIRSSDGRLVAVARFAGATGGPRRPLPEGV